jgi:glucokinase
MPDLILKEVEASARNHTMKALRDSFRVVAAKLGDDATAVGAAAWTFETISAGEKGSK